MAGLAINTFVIFIANLILDKATTVINSGGTSSKNPIVKLYFMLVGFTFKIMNKVLKEEEKRNFYISKLVATGVVLMWNFLANFFLTFHGVVK